MKIRAAESRDVASMVTLSRTKRQRYSKHSPVFWKPAENADEKQVGYFTYLVGEENTRILVAEESGKIVGFIIGQIRNPPPVYAPGAEIRIVESEPIRSVPPAPCYLRTAEWVGLG